MDFVSLHCTTDTPTYVALSDFGTYEEDTSRRIDTTATAATEIYDNIRAISASVSSLVSHTESGGEYMSVISSGAYVKTGLLYEKDDGTPVYGMEIGQKVSSGGTEIFNKYARFTSEKISFFDSVGNEVAYIGDSCLAVSSARVGDMLKLGGYTLTFTDGITLRWTGN